ncbi:hypothetical protein ACLMJK_008827 [Lecanora helva]
MCGLIAIVALQQPQLKPNASARIDRGLAEIKHRGPDSQGKWIDPSGRIALGHVRLQINDLSPSGNQPLHDEDHSIHAVVNGEIYDYDRLRAEMIEKIGYHFRGRSDCELVLALYKCYGFSFLSHLRGEFSLCLYDSRKELFVAVRDRYGIKPLFWTVQNEELMVAAEMKALVPLGWKPNWNVKGIIDGNFQAGSGTIFQDVQKVRPGHFLLRQDKVTECQYWDMEYPSKMHKELRTEEEMVQGVRSQLLDAIRVRLRADVKVGVALSGGIDSSVVAGMVSHLIQEGEKIGSDALTEKLSCFGVSFDEGSGFDESATADRTAEFLGVKYFKKHMDEATLAANFENATWLDEQPNPDLNFIGLYALSELVREQGFRVILNGQGSDEIFGGYPIFLPDFLREADESFKVSGEKPRRTEFEKVVKRADASVETPTLMGQAYPLLPLVDGLEQQNYPYQRNLPSEKLTKWHPFHSGQYIFCKAHLENLILSHLGDRGEMAHSIEGRTPFLDHHLTEYVNNLPPNMKIRWNDGFVEKYVLREAARPFVTDEIYKKRKHPYSAPLKYNIGGPMHQLMRRLVTDGNVERLGFLRKDDWTKMVDRAFTGYDSIFKLVICVAQWVVLGDRFGVEKANVAHTKA